MHYLDEGSRGHTCKAFMVQEICRHFSDAWFSWEYTRPKCLAAKWTLVISRIVRCKRFLVDRLKDSDVFFLLVSQPICTTCAIICQLRDELRVEALPNLIKNISHFISALERAVDLNVRILQVDLLLDPQNYHYHVLKIPSLPFYCLRINTS